MKYNDKFTFNNILLILIITLFINNVISAQSFRMRSSDQKSTISVEAGIMGSFIAGEARGGVYDMIDNFAYRETENDQENLQGKTPISLTPFLGIHYSYQLKDRLSLQGGIRYNRRGYKFKIKGEVKDNEFQVDHRYKYLEKYQFSTIEIPFSASFQLGDKVLFNAGFLIGFALKNSSKTVIDISEEVLINGTLRSDIDGETIKTEIEDKETPNGAFIGVALSLDYLIYNNLYLSVGITRVNNYAQPSYGKVSDNSLSLSVKYLLPKF